MLAMPARPEANTVPVTIRMDRETRERLLKYAERYPFRLTLTQLIDAAILEYLERHEHGPLPPPVKSKRDK
jgi:hypothetical protein